MELKILHEIESILFKRKDYLYEVSFEGPTPSFDQIKKLIMESSKVDEDLLVVKKIKQKYGTRKVEISARIYNSPEDLKRTEIRSKKTKKKEGKKKEEKK